jgi:hypothetical protein
MGLREALFGRRTAPAPSPAPPAAPSPAGGPPAEPAGPGETHFFICSPNESLIAAHDEVLKAGLPAYGGTAERYSCCGSDLEEREHQAKAADMPFSGVSRMGSSEKSPGKMADVLSSIRVGSIGDTHVEHVKVKDSGAPWVRTVYETLLKEGMSQGILPYYMHETKDDGEARYLLDSLRRVM